ncbi:MAG: HEPN domain-containing protein [Oscillospiraceae bacterium]|nr:HEPN domain-containing protein [Oscillospiraceae bacterium]
MHDVQPQSLNDVSINRIEHALRKLKAANVLYGEEMYEDACNRAYYAVYHSIRSVLALDNREFSSHGETLGYYRKEFLKTNIHDRSLSNTIKITETLRTGGDYDDFLEIVQKDAEEALQLATSFYEYMSKYIQLRIDEKIKRDEMFDVSKAY